MIRLHSVMETGVGVFLFMNPPFTGIEVPVPRSREAQYSCAGPAGPAEYMAPIFVH